MNILDYFSHITIEDLVDNGVLDSDKIIKNELGYFIFENCAFSNSDEFYSTYMPLNHNFKILICTNINGCEYNSLHLLNVDGSSTEIKEYMDAQIQELKNNGLENRNILDFMSHFERFSSRSNVYLVAWLVEKFNIEIPAEVYKNELVHGKLFR